MELGLKSHESEACQTAVDHKNRGVFVYDDKGVAIALRGNFSVILDKWGGNADGAP